MANVVLKAHADAIDWIDVVSTNVKAIAYSPGLRRLFVQFLNGSRYVYFDVPPVVFDGFVEASSPGGYLWEKIRNKGLDNLYGYEKL